MKRKRTLLILFGIVLLTLSVVRIAQTQTQKHDALTYLAQYGKIGDWEFLGIPLIRVPSTPDWLPGVWPSHLAINAIPPDPVRYAAAVRKLPRLKIIMVFVYEPMSLEVFQALGAVPGPKILDLTSSSVTDDALRRFTQVATTEELLLNHSHITDASLPQILKFRHARVVSLYTNELSDANLLKLAELPAMETLDLNANVSPETIAALRAQKPTLQGLPSPQ